MQVNEADEIEDAPHHSYHTHPHHINTDHMRKGDWQRNSNNLRDTRNKKIPSMLALDRASCQLEYFLRFSKIN
jgi:hypothetical protein